MNSLRVLTAYTRVLTEYSGGIRKWQTFQLMYGSRKDCMTERHQLQIRFSFSILETSEFLGEFVSQKSHITTHVQQQMLINTANFINSCMFFVFPSSHLLFRLLLLLKCVYGMDRYLVSVIQYKDRSVMHVVNL